MKKVMMMCAVFAMAVVANAGDCCWSWWVGDDKADKNLRGCQLGIASECKEIKGAQVSLLWNRCEKAGGCQYAFGYNNAAKMINGPQLGVVNIAREGAALQFGLLCFNKNGFLPFFVFFNFDSSKFGNFDAK